ncbi:MAG: SGNH/GDSL hydrolase family protein [Clostridiales bacterium]|nr:SGNH/GDSL hydrolase family protein [Clostridiales bacterium]
MNRFLRTVCVFVLFLMVFTMLVACKPDNNTPPSYTPPAIEYTIDESVLQTNKTANDSEFYASAVTRVSNSPLAGKTIYWLGSSVTYGANSGGESMAEFLAAKTGANCVKDAVSGTTIFNDGKSAATGKDSYVNRLVNGTKFDTSAHVDAFICQISTNDARNDRLNKRGEIAEGKDRTYFDTATTLGGVEYIISYVVETWHCPVYFYSGSFFGDSGVRSSSNPTGTNYGKLIDDVKDVVSKWQNYGYDVDVIDLFNDSDFNSQVTDDYYKWCTNDAIHPKRAGYLNWWMPYFEQYLIVKFEN